MCKGGATKDAAPKDVSLAAAMHRIAIDLTPDHLKYFSPIDSVWRPSGTMLVSKYLSEHGWRKTPKEDYNTAPGLKLMSCLGIWGDQDSGRKLWNHTVSFGPIVCLFSPVDFQQTALGLHTVQCVCRRISRTSMHTHSIILIMLFLLLNLVNDVIDLGFQSVGSCKGSHDFIHEERADTCKQVFVGRHLEAISGRARL